MLVYPISWKMLSSEEVKIVYITEKNKWQNKGKYKDTDILGCNITGFAADVH